MTNILEKILADKEARQAHKKELSELGFAIISFNLNIPGYPKTNADIEKTFKIICSQLKNYLMANRIFIEKSKTTIRTDNAGHIIFLPFKPQKAKLAEIKQLLEYFEINHTLGRLLDVDLFDLQAMPVSSQKLKNCFICPDSPAIECMKKEKHTFKDLQHVIECEIDKFLNSYQEKKISRQLSEFAIQAILYEVSLPGKPGLVCPESSGSHIDMNYYTFLNSTGAISTFFEQIANLGFCWNGLKCKDIIVKIRILGIEMEQAMYAATKGINTQKGIIFLIGYALFIAAYTFKSEGKFNIQFFQNHLKLITQGLVASELLDAKNQNKSNGEKCFNQYGEKLAGGIRQEIEDGLPTIFNVSLPFMSQLFPTGIEISDQNKTNNNLMQLLLKIVSVNNDTNILHRANENVLFEVKEKAKDVVKQTGNIYENELYKELFYFCNEKNISPGGSADLMALTIFMYKIIKF